MSLIRIDETKCRRDGVCAAVCPARLITRRGEEFPEPIPGAEGLCIACGHCVAACPTGALSNRKVPLEDCPPIRRDLQVNSEALEQFLKTRRSTRVFKERPVPRDILDRVIDSARWAPSAVNIQPVRWTVVGEPGGVKHLAGLSVEWMRSKNWSYGQSFVAAWDQGEDRVLRSAPHLVVASASTGNPWSQCDCSIALTYLELAAQANGLGTCWAGLFVRAAENSASIRESLGVAEGDKVYGAVMLGYPKWRYQRIPNRNKAKITWV